MGQPVQVLVKLKTLEEVDMTRYLTVILVVLASSAHADVLSGYIKTGGDYFFFSQALPFLFGIYNYGILACLGFLAAYTLIYAGALAASEGAGIARKLNTWVIIRSILGAALLIPYGDNLNNFALIQRLVIQVVKSSLTFAGNFLVIVTSSLNVATDSNQAGQVFTNVDVALKTVVDMAYDQLLLTEYCRAFPAETECITGGDYSKPKSAIQQNHSPLGDVEVNLQENISAYKGLIQTVIALEKQKYLIDPQNGAEDWTAETLQAKLYETFGGSESIVGLKLDNSGGAIQHDPPKVDKLNPVQSMRSIKIKASILNQMETGQGPTGIIFQDNFDQMFFSDVLVGLGYIMDKMMQTVGSKPSKATDVSQYFGVYKPPLNLDKTIKGKDFSVNIQYIKDDDYSGIIDMANSQVAYAIMKSSSDELKEKLSKPIKSGNIDIDINEGKGTGVEEVQTLLVQLEGGSEGIKSASSQPLNLNYGGSITPERIHKIPSESDEMLKKMIEALTGYSSVEKTVSPGLYTYSDVSVSPIKYLSDMGQKMINASIDYTKNAITGDDGVMATDAQLAQEVWSMNSALLSTARALSTGAEASGPFVGWVRSVVFGANAGIAIGIERYNYKAGLDQELMYLKQPIGAAISQLLMIWGLIFSVFLPTVPYMILLFSFAGWVLLIVEVMVASPLVALGLAHPSSQQFLGASDQVLMMLLVMYLRPLLIIFSVLFATLLSYIALSYLNLGFVHLLNVAIFSGTLKGGVQLAAFIGTMLIYSYVAFVVILQAFSLIGSLPDKIGSWIGVGPMGGTSPLEQVLGVRQDFEGGVSAGAQGVSSLGANAKLQTVATRYENITKIIKSDAGERLLARAGKHDKAIQKLDPAQKKHAEKLKKEGKSDKEAYKAAKKLNSWGPGGVFSMKKLGIITGNSSSHITSKRIDQADPANRIDILENSALGRVSQSRSLSKLLAADVGILANKFNLVTYARGTANIAGILGNIAGSLGQEFANNLNVVPNKPLGVPFAIVLTPFTSLYKAGKSGFSGTKDIVKDMGNAQNYKSFAEWKKTENPFHNG